MSIHVYFLIKIHFSEMRAQQKVCGVVSDQRILDHSLEQLQSFREGVGPGHMKNCPFHWQVPRSYISYSMQSVILEEYLDLRCTSTY